MSIHRGALSDRVLVWVLRLCGLLSAVIVIGIVVFVSVESIPVLGRVGALRFLNDASWHPSEQMYNLSPMIAGTLLTTFGAVLLATPLGVGSALFCTYYAPVPLGRGIQRLLELSAGIPSVVYGFWGLVTLVPLIGDWHPPGSSLLTGILILTLMIVPTVALSTHAAFATVPPTLLQGAAALGLSRSATIFGVIFPTIRSALATGILLQTGRALGETMALLMVCGNVIQMPSGLFEPVRTLTTHIALEMAYATGDHRGALFVSGLLLLLLTVVLLFSARTVERRVLRA